MMPDPALAAGGLTLDDAAVERFAAEFHGEVLRPGNAGFAEARRVWNGMIDRTPALIARCAGVADVAAAVNFARERRLLVAVRGGGHNVTGNAVCDRGLVIDLSHMRAIRVDPARRTVRVEGGATWGDLDREAQAFALATTGGNISTTGVGGLTLGGGLGRLVRQHGLACDNLLAVEVVTAAGRLVTASTEEQADLFWGVRGGGGNFGVVTSLEFRLHPVGPVLGGLVLHPLEAAPAVLRFFREFTRQAPEELTTSCALLTAPDGTPVVALIPCYNGDLVAGEAALRPLRAFGSPVADLVRPLAYREMQSLLDAGFPEGLRNYWRGDFLRALPDEAIDRISVQAARMTSPQSALLLEYYGGAASRVDPGATAFPHRRAMYAFLTTAMWTDPAEDGRHIGWARETAAALAPYASGAVYVNYLGTEGEERVRAAYGANYDRLAALKAKYDPANLFRMNQNIRPQA